jgi:large subunit ribosomal protein L23
MSLDLRQVIVKPLVTEKSSAVYQLQKAYTFEVHPTASKPQIKHAIETLFGVHVTDVWTSRQRGKTRRVGRTLGQRPHWKKAIVRLREGDAIEIFEG